MKKILINLLICLMLVISCNEINAYAFDNRINLNCIAGTVIDQNSGRILYSKNGDMVLPMASTTKIITAIVAIENGTLDKKVIVSKNAASINGSSAGLKEGEKITLEELIYGLMLRSGNDAAIAIAENVGGSVDNFVKMMNFKAIELGLYDTSFESPHGLDKQMHYTTAIELAKATAYAMKNNLFSEIVATKTINTGRFGSFNRSYSNINKFIYKVEGADGVKTGFTGNAGKCLVASVKSEKGRYIAVVLNSSQRWKDAQKLVEFAKTKYKYIKVCDKNAYSYKICNQKLRKVISFIATDYYVPVLKDNSEGIQVHYLIPKQILMPIDNKSMIGNIAVTVNNKIISTCNVFAKK